MIKYKYMENYLSMPLAEKMRPTKLSEVVGQEHLLGDDGILTKIVKNKQPISIIFWGPAGCGKTTLARIIAKEVEADFIELSAVTSGKKDIEEVIKRAEQNWNLRINTIVFVDEIHRFNKSQQDAFLPHVESGLISLIGATTENPAFEVITPLISRSRVLTLKPLEQKNITTLLKRALAKYYPQDKYEEKALEIIAKASSGDARVALGNLEVATKFDNKITLQTLKKTLNNNFIQYDKKGDAHYDNISAFIKSMRGSDVDATCYYLARMLKAGEDPKFIARRMIIFASEDIGLAGNGALSLANSCFDAVTKIGMPEANYVLFHTASALAKCKKSRLTTDIMHKSYKLVNDYPFAQIPLHLRNSTSKITEELGYTKGYEWKANFRHPKGFLPEDIQKILKNKSPRK